MSLPVPFPAVTRYAKLNRQWNGGARLEGHGLLSTETCGRETTLAAA